MRLLYLAVLLKRLRGITRMRHFSELSGRRLLLLDIFDYTVRREPREHSNEAVALLKCYVQQTFTALTRT